MSIRRSVCGCNGLSKVLCSEEGSSVEAGDIDVSGSGCSIGGFVLESYLLHLECGWKSSECAIDKTRCCLSGYTISECNCVE